LIAEVRRNSTVSQNGERSEPHWDVCVAPRERLSFGSRAGMVMLTPIPVSSLDGFHNAGAEQG